MIQRFKMQDYSIDVDYGIHVIRRLNARFDGLSTAFLDFILETILTNEEVADYLINNVRIGEDVVVIDEDSGVSFAMNIGLDCFYVKTVYNTDEDNMFVGDMQKVLHFARKDSLRIEEFQRRRTPNYA